MLCTPLVTGGFSLENGHAMEATTNNPSVPCMPEPRIESFVYLRARLAPGWCGKVDAVVEQGKARAPPLGPARSLRLLPRWRAVCVEELPDLAGAANAAAVYVFALGRR